jgi:homocitrate synthase NifV
MGVERIRYADTVGIAEPRILFNQIKKIREKVPVEIEIHTHNDFGMAIANSLLAVDAGAKFVDCTIAGVGERAGNCNFSDFIKVMYELKGKKLWLKSFEDVIEKERQIKKIVGFQ